jgi:glutaredoxin
MKVTIWSKDQCAFCDQAKNLLMSRDIEFEERKIGYNATREQLLEAVPNARTVPQIFVDEQHIGGYAELRRHLGIQ